VLLEWVLAAGRRFSQPIGTTWTTFGNDGGRDNQSHDGPAPAPDMV
jgi:hypothetical protein